MTWPGTDDPLVEKVARVLLHTADVHDLGWNNLRTTAEALLPLFAEAWDEGYMAADDHYEDAANGKPVPAEPLWTNPYRAAARGVEGAS